ncbi:hypothetical protein GYMLUDRAFT_265291 [Collybiopsis luxurians FD-317 M1]|uniref:Uncharacterized protein n=1 Tax=Collybiopsis luxurians FD-317 M1 TaxID=944289 RepID=A0A0D0BTK2_9AGAR|nr:hypothetical protein GYMLUDRAFT_265291 [Collybiopsis luxurians FD-317 M1]
MTNYNLDVLIDKEQLQLLLDNSYTLCIARKVNDQYNVVWKSIKDLKLEDNRFEWANKYQVFASNTFKAGALVEAVSNDEPIQYGQECVLDEDKVMELAKADPARPPDTFKVTNKNGAIPFGISADVGGEYHAIYVSPMIGKGHAVFAPVNEVRVWFALNLPTGTMFSDFTGEYIELRFGGGKNTSKICFDQSGTWKLIV